jgi:hypothetical protein
LSILITSAGVKPWPKLFQNLRASRATELAAEFPAHVAADWLGHSTMVAQKHYWRTQDSDFEKAISQPTKPVENRDAKSGALPALQNQDMQENEINCIALQNAAPTTHNNPKTSIFTVFSSVFQLEISGRSGTRTPTPCGTRS